MNGKYILSSDWHVRASNPIYRIDDYCSSILSKIEFIVKTCNKHNADLLIGGDIFHSVKVNIRTINRLIRILKKMKGLIFTVPGQHDQENHSEDMTPTPYQNLIEAGVIIDIQRDQGAQGIYGIGWNGDLSEDLAPGRKAILVMHYCITDGDPAFFLEEDGSSAEDIMENFSDFQFIVSGDYHVPHITKKDKRILVNCGAIGRAEKDKFNYEPMIHLLDVNAAKVTSIKIPIAPPEEVFKIPENTKELDEAFAKHIEDIVKLSENKEETPKFINTVRNILKKTNCTDRQKEIAELYYNGAKDA